MAAPTTTKPTTGNVNDVPKQHEYNWLSYEDAIKLEKRYLDKNFVKKDADEEDKKKFFWKVTSIRAYEPANFASPHPEKTLVQFEAHKYYRNKMEKVMVSDGNGGTAEVERNKRVESLVLGEFGAKRVDTDKEPAWIVVDSEAFKKDFAVDNRID